MKTRSQIIKQPFVSISDISTLFIISYRKAKEAYLKAEMMESNDYRLYDHKVNLQNVCKVLNVRYSFLKQTIESEET